MTVNSTLLRELVRYRKSLKLADYPVPGEDFPLVASVNAARRSKPLTPRAIGLLVGTIGQRAAAECADEHCRAQPCYERDRENDDACGTHERTTLSQA